MDTDRRAALTSRAGVRMITGDPGVGKTYFGCQIAEYEMVRSGTVEKYQKILFLTFARNAVARIREAYLRNIIDGNELCEMSQERRTSLFYSRIRISTFSGFFWWFVESYGRYVPGHTSDNRPWFIGTKRTGSESIPDQYEGYTFEELEDMVYRILRVDGIQKLISRIYPFIIVDEFQDVNDSLMEIILLLGRESRLVLLSGPGQCIYRAMKRFDPEAIVKKCVEHLRPEMYKINPEGEQKQRYCKEIKAFLSQYNTGKVSLARGWPVNFRLVTRRTKNNVPRELETEAAKMVQELRTYLKNTIPDKRHSICILSSTNLGAADIYRRLKEGREVYHVPPMPVTLVFDDVCLLQYGRLILELLEGHWISGRRNVDSNKIVQALTALFLQADTEIESPKLWKALASKLSKKVQKQQPPSDAEPPYEKLNKDLNIINNLLRSPKKKLPAGSPPTPFDKSDSSLLEVLKNELVKSIKAAFPRHKVWNIQKVKDRFENAMRKRIILEKLGIESGIQVMTIHKVKGKEFDGVILVFEDSRKALWRQESRTGDQELEDIYRVALTRARHALGVVAFDDAFERAKPSVQKLLS